MSIRLPQRDTEEKLSTGEVSKQGADSEAATRRGQTYSGASCWGCLRGRGDEGGTERAGVGVWRTRRASGVCTSGRCRLTRPFPAQSGSDGTEKQAGA